MNLAHLIFQIGADSSELEKEARKARQTVTNLTDSMVSGFGQAGRASAQLDNVGMSAKQTAAAMRGVPAQIRLAPPSIQPPTSAAVALEDADAPPPKNEDTPLTSAPNTVNGACPPCRLTTMSVSFGVPGRERGGSVAAGAMYEVNEAGVPELLNIGQRQYLMMGQQSGSVVPLAGYSGGAVANAGGSQAAAPMQIDVQVINQGQPAQAEATVERQADGRALVKVILREVAGDMAAGGVTARAVKQRFALQEA